MKLAKTPSIRRLFFKSVLQPRYQQRRWARVQDIRFNDVRFLATQATQDRVFDKYREKLARKVREEGHKDVGSLKDAYKEKIESMRKQTITKNKPDAIQIPFNPPPPPQQHPESVQNKAAADKAPVKSLSSFLDIDKTLSLPLKEIEYIWRLRHANNANSLCAVIPAEQYAHIQLRARKHPQFVLPVPREEQGAEIHFMQWSFPQMDTATVLFTQLAEYKLRGEYASPHTTVTFHTELLQHKGIVLAQGDVLPDRGVSIDDGKWLFMCLQKFYGAARAKGDDKTRKLLEQFSSGDEGFRIQELLDEAERIA